MKNELDIGKIEKSFFKKEREKIKDSVIALMQKKVKRIRSGKVIKRGYSKYTIKARKSFGLQTKYVDLTGNRLYSKKSWRLLDSWKVRFKKKDTVVVEWTKNEAATLYGYHVKRYGPVFKNA